LIFYLILGGLFLTSFIIDYAVSGDFLHYLHQELKYAPKPSLLEAVNTWYFKWMFTRDMSFGILLFGYFFHLAIFGLIYCIVKDIKRSYILQIWFFTIFLFLNFLPMKINPYMVPPRFFRYTHAFFIPAVLILAFAIGSIWNFAIVKFKKHSNSIRVVFLAILIALTCTSLYEGIKLANLYQDSFNDSKEAALFLAKLDPKPIYSDNTMLDRFNFYTGYERTSQTMWSLGGFSFQREIVERHNYEPLKEISDAYIVSGGARAPDISPYFVLNLDSFEKPENWKLIATIKRNLTWYRTETLKIYYVPK